MASAWKRLAREMMPHRVAWRVFVPGAPYPSRKRLKAKFAARTVATGGRRDYERVLAASNRAAKKTAASKPAKGDVYAAARQLPARNRAAAKENAAVVNKTAARQVAVQGEDGRFRGSVVLPGADLTLYRQARGGNAVIQPGEPKRRRL